MSTRFIDPVQFLGFSHSTWTPPSAAHHSQIYSSTLSTALQEGYPLWFPEPHDTGEVQIGDVGYIHEGAFVRLFNVNSADPSHAVTRWPLKFKPADLPSNALIIEPRHNALGPGRIRSKGVEESRVALSAQADGVAGAGAGFAIEFTCKEEQGAMLDLKTPATMSSIYDNRRIKDYILKNYDKWYHYATEELELEIMEKRIIFIRGWGKTSSDWTVTAFTSSGAKWKAALQAQAGPAASVGMEVMNRQTMEGPVITRFGTRIVSQHSADPGDSTQDQCVFLKYYCVKHRRWLSRRIEANAGPHQLPDHPGDPSGPAVPADAPNFPDVVADDGTTLDNDFASPVDALLDYILEFSDAEVAIACDDEISRLLEGQEWPDDIGLYLRQTQPRIEVNSEKHGMLSLFDSIRRHRVNQISNRSIDDLEGDFNLPDNQTQAGGLADGRILVGPSQTSTTALDWPHLQFKHKDTENGAVTSVSLSPDGKLVAASWDDITVTVWRLKDGLTVQNLEDQGHHDTVWTIVFSPDSASLVSGSADATAIVWHVASGNVISRLEGHTSDVMTAAFSADGSIVATGSTDCTVKLWEPTSGDLLYNLQGHTSDIMRVAFSADGRRLATCADSGVVLWDPSSGRQVTALDGHTSAVWCMAFSPQGDRIVTGSEDNSARVWDAISGDELTTIQEHTDSVWAVAFSPDGGEVASASFDATVVTCDSWTGEERHVLRDPQLAAVVETVAYSTKGELIASGSADGHVRMWYAKSGAFVAEFQGHEEKVKSVMFSSDDRHLVSYGEDGAIRVWDVVDALRLAY